MTREVKRLCDMILPGQILGESLDLEATEMSVRHSMHKVGTAFLEKLANVDSGKKGSTIDCDAGHVAKFSGYHTKQVLTVLGEVSLRRAYYPCVTCESGMFPKDIALDIEGTRFSPGVRRMMARVGAKESFDAGRGDMESLAGIVVTAKEVERVSEAIGEDIEVRAKKDRHIALSPNVTPLTLKIPILYAAMDGTGVPATSRETAGRKGKDVSGIAKTREAKLGVLFTQTGFGKDGNPIRDENSTTYTGAIEPKEEFARRLYAEALRRGLSRAERFVVLGDGAVWIWEIVAEYFPHAIMILDFYHATEHLAEFAKIIHANNKTLRDTWMALYREQLLKGDVEIVIEAMKRVEGKTPEMKEAIRKTIHYFETNRSRMNYAEYQKQGLFIGSGVMEAGCKTIVGQRLKQSGMRWTVRGANAIIALRCCQQSGQWEDYWESRTAA